MDSDFSERPAGKKPEAGFEQVPAGGAKPEAGAAQQPAVPEQPKAEGQAAQPTPPDQAFPVQPARKKGAVPLIIGVCAVVVVALIGVGAFMVLRGGMGGTSGAVPSSAPAASSAAASTSAPATSGSAASTSAATTDDGVIHAQGVDTSSKFTFSVDTAVAGIDEATGQPVVALLGTFTNNSDKPMEFSSTLDAVATQGGAKLSETYLSGESDLNYADVQPGESATVAAAWVLNDGETPVHISVTDLTHYKKAEVYSGDFTIDELIANLGAAQDEVGNSMESDPSLGA